MSKIFEYSNIQIFKYFRHTLLWWSTPCCSSCSLDSIAVSVFVVILVEFDKYWDGCGDPLRAAAESLKSLSSVKIGCNSRFMIWICFWCILFTFQQQRRTFPPAFLFYQLPQIWENTPIGLHKRLNFGKHSHWLAQNWSTNRNVFPKLRHWERWAVLGVWRMVPADGAHCCSMSSKVQDLNSTATVDNCVIQLSTCESQLELYKRIDNCLIFLAKNWKHIHFRSLKGCSNTPCFQCCFGGVLVSGATQTNF